MKNGIVLVLLLLLLTACDGGDIELPADQAKPGFVVAAILEAKDLDEVSGIQSGAGGRFYLHNDDGSPSIYVAASNGRHLGKITIRGARNRDWEDISRIPGENGPMLVLGDIGDNLARYKSIKLYFVAEPQPSANGAYAEKVDLLHELKLRYPDGPRDCEAMAYDPASNMLLFLSKRDHPPRLYGLPLAQALQADQAELHFLAYVPGLRPPVAADLLHNKKRGKWISQPTGMDISGDGRRAAVITYRSLYLFERAQGESWAEAFGKTPLEYVGPPGWYDEAVTFGFDTPAVYVSTERRPTPVYRLVLP